MAPLGPRQTLFSHMSKTLPTPRLAAGPHSPGLPLQCLFTYLPPPWDWVFQGHCLTHLVLIVAQFGATYGVGAQMFVCRAPCSLHLRQGPKELDEASRGGG